MTHGFIALVKKKWYLVQQDRTSTAFFPFSTSLAFIASLAFIYLSNLYKYSFQETMFLVIFKSLRIMDLFRENLDTVSEAA